MSTTAPPTSLQRAPWWRWKLTRAGAQGVRPEDYEVTDSGAVRGAVYRDGYGWQFATPYPPNGPGLGFRRRSDAVKALHSALIQDGHLRCRGAA